MGHCARNDRGETLTDSIFACKKKKEKERKDTGVKVKGKQNDKLRETKRITFNGHVVH